MFDPSVSFSLLASSAPCAILCVGDMMLDRYVRGVVSRVSPEAPVPVLHQIHQTEMLGGVGNVTENLKALKLTPLLMAAVGEDSAGQAIRQSTATYGACDFARLPQTSIKTRYLAQNHHLLRVDEEAFFPISEEQVLLWMRLLADWPPFQAIILSDYGKGMLTPSLCQAMIRLGHERKIPVLVDPKGTCYEKYRGATFLTPNMKEFQQALGHSVERGTLQKYAAEVMDRYNLKGILVTQSEKGMTLVTRLPLEESITFFNDVSADSSFSSPHSLSPTLIHIPTVAKEVFDVSGAGDTVIATFAAGLGKGLSPLAACHWANQAAGMVVGKVGTATVSLDELHPTLRQESSEGSFKTQPPLMTSEPPSFSQKILSLEALKVQVAQWREQNHMIGLTNGCFDVIHPGHLTTLQTARSHCDRLIVALNTDASVRHLKGPQRPLQPQETRCLILAALAVVDAVVLFEEETPLEIVCSVLPDVLIKGGDYTKESVVGGDMVEQSGGKVILVPLKPGYSTTAFLERTQTSFTKSRVSREK